MSTPAVCRRTDAFCLNLNFHSIESVTCQAALLLSVVHSQVMDFNRALSEVSDAPSQPVSIFGQSDTEG